MLNALVIAAAAAAILVAPPRAGPPGRAGEMRGIWAECEGANNTFARRAGIEEMFERLEAARINTVFMQVYRGNKSWYPSRLADDTPSRKFSDKEGVCPLRLALDLAHAKGMKLHAWVNVYRLWNDRGAKAIKALGKGAVTRDRGGRSLLDYDRASLPDSGYWLDPGDPEARDYLIAVVEELLDRYPDLDGVHLDYVRYPFDEKGKTEFGYAKRAVAAFTRALGLKPSEAGARWDDWRRDQVTGFVTRVKRLASARGMAFSVATIQDQERAVSASFQDWPRWLRDGLVDFAVPMVYSSRMSVVRKNTVAALKAGGDRVCIGLGAYKVLDDPAALVAQIEECRRLGARGTALFSYDNMAKRPALFRYLGEKACAAAPKGGRKR